MAGVLISLIGSLKRFVSGGLNDATFNAIDSYTGPNSTFTVSSSAVLSQPDGKLLLGGTFTTFNGVAAGSLVRLNADGSLDSSFMAAIGTAANTFVVSALALDPTSGDIIVGGSFTSWNGVSGVGGIVRLYSDGSRNSSFSTGTGGVQPKAIVVQSDGKVVIAGSFTTWNGATVNGIVRLNTDGSRDTTFTTNTGTAGGAAQTLLALQPDGKILVGGTFTTWNGASVVRLVRLNTDGTRDATFTTNMGTGPNNTVLGMVVQSTGKIVITGGFTTWGGVTVNKIVRLNTDGTRDTAFTTNTGTGFDTQIPSPSAIGVQSDDKIVIAGQFQTLNGVAVNRAIRLNSDGTKDTGFATALPNTGPALLTIQADGQIVFIGAFTLWGTTTSSGTARVTSSGSLATYSLLTGLGGANGAVNALAVQSNGQIIIGGAFTSFNGSTSAVRIARVSSAGVLDTAFATNTGTGASGIVWATFVQSDGKIVVGGAFGTWNGATVNGIVRLNTDGTLDAAFATNTGTGGTTIITAALQSDGKILVGGNFTTWNGTAVTYIVRLNSDGTRDTTFTTNIGTGPNAAIQYITVQPDGKVLVSGAFTAWNGTTTKFVRLNSNGTIDASFVTNTGTGPNGLANVMTIQSDGKILVGGTFTTWNGTTASGIARLNSDGTLDTAFVTNTGLGATVSTTVNVISLQSDGKIVVGGAFGTFNGASTYGGIVRLNADGTVDSGFKASTGTGFTTATSITAMARQSDGKILVGGNFTFFNSKVRTRLARITIDGYTP
ncbi:Delta-60 repeat [uncultured Caudovirales phage]|uniref:Delta-60 repeat n=1 Tax=uncultured Caudovirales phage TaxID=2100421 RepID=A0A6J5KN39_9CAUD|nr:Delta-60 repeat [uncultured Caudovirales phage]